MRFPTVLVMALAITSALFVLRHDGALAGSGTDPEGQGLTYTWVQVSGTPVVLDDPSAASPSFDAPEGLVNSDLVFELQVSDGTNVSTDAELHRARGPRQHRGALRALRERRHHDERRHGLGLRRR